MIDKRMMYAQGQRVAKSLDGSRPGYRGSDMATVSGGTGLRQILVLKILAVLIMAEVIKVVVVVD